MNETQEMVAVPAPATEIGNVLQVSDQMVMLTWVAFLLACFALYKLAWKPICQALDRREDKIRQSLQAAEDIRAQAELDKEAQRVMLANAKQEAAALVARAQEAAAATAKAVEEKAAADAAQAVRAAEDAIRRAQEQAVGELRRTAAELALDVAGRVLDQKLDAPADHALTDRLLQELE